jgi:hypothetical protein
MDIWVSLEPEGVHRIGWGGLERLA